VFSNSFESLLGPRSFTVLSILSKVVRNVLFVPGPWVMNLPHHAFIFESTPFEDGCSAHDEIFTWEIHLCNLNRNLKLLFEVSFSFGQ